MRYVVALVLGGLPALALGGELAVVGLDADTHHIHRIAAPLEVGRDLAGGRAVLLLLGLAVVDKRLVAAVGQHVAAAVLQLLEPVLLEQVGSSEVWVVRLRGRQVHQRGVLGQGALGADAVEAADEVEELLGPVVAAAHDRRVLLGSDGDLAEGLLAEEEVQLAPVVIPACGVVAVLEGVHGDAAGLVARDDFCDEEAVAHVLAVVLDGVGEVEALHPLEHLAREGALVLQVVEGAVGLAGGGLAGRAHLSVT